ncbi:MAG: hypothetical protein FJZ86_17080 [Chloroflexi bacterium]|nr:hypothetical protein [Chloroflexota bacterium]
MERSNWVETWFSRVRDRTHLKVIRIPFNASAEWEMKDGWLVHKSGRFFQVVAIQWDDFHHQSHAQPILRQQEMGTLGFILNNFELLMQAKVEPGNVGGVQMAPTCQATASNMDRIHGGDAPLFSDRFTYRGKNQIYESLQSEQGSRFFRKFNRNALLLAGSREPPNENYRWVPVDAVMELLHEDCLINTDARSVLVCSPWELLVNRDPFTRESSHFARDLAASLVAPIPKPGIETELWSLRTTIHQPFITRLDELDGWQVGEESIVPISGKPFGIFQIRIEVASREVSNWDQPILSSFGEGYAELVCGRIDGVLHFLFSFQIEAGLGNAVELGPSLVIEPGEGLPKTTYVAHPNAVVLAEYKQSDEGGRFFQDISIYRLIDIGEVPDDLKLEKWLTLAEIRALLSAGGWFTNEARSALSLLLPWL